MAVNVFEMFAKLSLDTSGFEKGLNAAKSAVSLGAKALGAATTAVVGFGAASVKTGMDFDQSMSQVAATMGKTVDDIQNLRDFAQQMGRTTKFTATESADALNYMALAGYTAEESMEMLPNVLNLAAAGSFDLARASDMVTDAQTAFGIEAERVTQMVDEMAKAASTGNTSVEQLGDAFLVVGGLAQELNGGMVELADGTTAEVDGIQELEIALTAMANAGVKGSEAGTHMRNMLLKLSDPTDEGVTALEKMGVTVFDTAGNMRSLADIFGDLNVAMDSMTQEQRIQTISALFNTRDIASAEALLNAVGQDWNEIGEAILNADGAAEIMANTQLDNLAGDVTLLKSAFEGFQIAVSDTLTGKTRDEGLRAFVNFGTDALSRLTGSFQNGGIDAAMEELGTLLAEGFNMLFDKIPTIVEGGQKLLSALGQGIMDNLPLLLDSSMQILQMFVEYLVQGLPTLISVGFEIISRIGEFIMDNLPMLFDSAVEILFAIVDGIVNNLDELIPAVIDMVLYIVEKLTEPDTLVRLVEAALKIIVALAEGLIAAIPKLVEKVPQIIENIVKTLIASLPKVVDAGLKIILALIDGILKSITKLPEAINKIKSTVTDGILELLSSADDWGRDLINNFIAGIKEKWQDFKNTISDMAGTVSEYLHFSEPDVGPLSNFHTFAPDMMKLFAEGIRDNEDLVANQISKSFDLGEYIQNQNVGLSHNNSRYVSNGEQSISVNVVLEPIGSEIFRVVTAEARKRFDSTGNNAVVYGG